MDINMSCRANGHPTTLKDKRYGEQAICRPCFAERKECALQAGDYDWFAANDLIPTLTEEERMRLGV